LDMGDRKAIDRIVTATSPDEIYQLSGMSSVAESFRDPLGAFQSNMTNTVNLLQSVHEAAAGARIYLAGSSECFGTTPEPATIETPFKPVSPYAAAKAGAYLAGAAFRRGFGLYVSNGVMFNHESPLRPDHFVTRKVVLAAGRIHRGSGETLALGDLSVCRDWGWAPEYVEAMWLTLQHDRPGDYVIATGETHSLGDFVKAVFDEIGLDWRDHVSTDPNLRRNSELNVSFADTSDTAERLGWRAEVKMHEVARRLIRYEIGDAGQSAADRV
jgi:GDPmannose 4,6-dehydratase